MLLQRFLQKNYRYLIFGILLLTSLLFIYKTQNRFMYTFGFTDEGDNISIGMFLLQGKRLYQDIFSQHQPVTYFVSSFIQHVSHPDNVLLVVRRHRQVIMFFSYLWIIFLCFRFSRLFLLFACIIEMLKYYFLGNLFLAESIVIYPLIYLFLLWWQLLHKKSLSYLEAAFASCMCFFVMGNLLPLFPTVLFFLGSFLFFLRKQKKYVVAFITPFLLLGTVLFAFVPVHFYIEDSILANIFYYLANSNTYAFKIDISMQETILNQLFSPLTTFFMQTNIFIICYRILAIVWVIAIVFYYKRTKHILPLILIYCVLLLANRRPLFASNIYFHAFHALPYFALFIASIYILCDFIWKTYHQYKVRVICFIPIVLLFILCIFDKSFYIHEKFLAQDVSYINFNTVFTYSETIKFLGKKNDTFAVIPYNELLYWYPHLSPPTRFLFYDSWVMDVPEFHKEIVTALRSNPPTFVFRDYPILEPYLHTKDYFSVPKDSTTSSYLFIYKKKLPAITNQQWENVKKHGFRKNL